MHTTLFTKKAQTARQVKYDSKLITTKGASCIKSQNHKKGTFLSIFQNYIKGRTKTNIGAAYLFCIIKSMNLSSFITKAKKRIYSILGFEFHASHQYKYEGNILKQWKHL